MKKVIFLISLCLLVVGVQAQDFALASKDSYKSYTGTAADTVTGATTLSKVVNINKDFLYYYDVMLDIDTVAGGGNQSISCILYGSNDNVNFTAISDVTYGASADTVFSYTNIGSRYTETVGAVTIAGYNEIHKGTSAIGAYNITADTTGLQYYFADTLAVAAQTTTYTDTVAVAAQTITSAGNTTVEKGVMWNYLKIALTGDGASAKVELQAIKVKVVKIP